MRLIALILILCGMAMPAHAVMVRNLSGEVQVVVVDHGGQLEEVVMEPGTVFRRHGYDIALQLPGKRKVQTEYYEEYAIWPNGSLILQKVNKARQMN